MLLTLNLGLLVMSYECVKDIVLLLTDLLHLMVVDMLPPGM